jgi:DNA-binding GntR family transcriptional regulator
MPRAASGGPPERIVAMGSAPMIRRRSLTDEVVPLMRDMILSGELKAGDKVPEAELCLRFGVSRTPLREALKVLAAEGLVHLTPNRGATIARITAEEIEQIFPIMGALEALAGEMATARMSDADIRRQRGLHERMLAAHAAGDWLSYAKTNRAIHEDIFAIADNAALSQLYQQLMARIHAVRFVARRSQQAWDRAVAEHQQIIAALEARDGAALAGILRQHLAHKAEVVGAALAEGLI